MITLDAIRQPVAGKLEEFEAFISKQFTAEGDMLSEMLSHALSARGKGVRPLLVFLTASMLSGDTSRVGSRSYIAAMLVEMIHTASLIHDDVIDEADQRRGIPSANAIWQSHNAVILGDFILARNMSIGLRSGQFDLITHIVDSMSALCEGEVLQSEAARKQIVSRERYFDIIRRKTASLLAVSASAGAISVGASSHDVEQMHIFGENLGIAFQIQDDILDYKRDAKTGKPLLNDLKEGKITLPLLHVLEHSSEKRRSELLSKLSMCHNDPEALEYMQTVVESCSGLQAASLLMQEYIDSSLEILSHYPESQWRTSLEWLCRFIVERNG